MTKQVTSDALVGVDRALGLPGGQASGATEFQDQQLDQVLDVFALARRGRTLAGTEGIMTVVLQNVHGAAGDLFTAWEPYNSDSTGVIAPYPSPFPRDMELWLLGAAVRRTAGAGDADEVGLTLASVQQGFGIDDTGNQVISVDGLPLAFWNVQRAVPFGGQWMQDTGGRVFAPIGIRIPPLGEGGVQSNFAQVVFLTHVSAAATYDCQILIGIFPAGMGQDVVAW